MTDVEKGSGTVFCNLFRFYINGTYSGNKKQVYVSPVGVTVRIIYLILMVSRPRVDNFFFTQDLQSTPLSYEFKERTTSAIQHGVTSKIR